MKFISAEEFLKQPKEVQKVFFEWANGNAEDYDLVQDNGEIMLYKDFIERSRIEFDSYPLFTEGWIRKFIEDKTDCKLQIYYNGDIGYTIQIGYADSFAKYEYDMYEDLGEDLLQAYWKVACEIVKGGH